MNCGGDTISPQQRYFERKEISVRSPHWGSWLTGILSFYIIFYDKIFVFLLNNTDKAVRIWERRKKSNVRFLRLNILLESWGGNPERTSSVVNRLGHNILLSGIQFHCLRNTAWFSRRLIQKT